MKNIFRGLIAMITLIALTGCMTAMISMADKLDERDRGRQQKGAQSFAETQHARFEALKAAGDPDGYYFLAIEFALSKVGNSTPENVAEIKRLYELAVAKGSNDAKVALGNMLVTGDTLPFEVTNAALPWRERDVKRGLKLMSEAATKSCMYKQPLYQDARCGNIRMANSAVKIWVPYRGGSFARNFETGEWVTLVPKNDALAHKWEQRVNQCDAEIQAFRKQHRCKIF